MKKIFIDIDDTICKTDGLDYTSATPMERAINRVNSLYDSGKWEITIWTARGTGSGKNWELITKKQLDLWGVKYHNLLFGKPVYDIFIDDKNINSIDWLDGKFDNVLDE